MKPERGYFKIEGDHVKWVASEEGMWILDPVMGLRQSGDPVIIAGSDLLREIDDAIIKKVKEL